DPDRRARVVEGRGPHLDRPRARAEELERVLAGPDAPDADNRDAHRLGERADHVEGDRLDGRPGEPARAAGEAWPPPLQVDRETAQRVDRGERAGPRRLRRPPDGGDVADVGLELHPEREAYPRP